MQTAMRRIGLADDHPVILNALQTCLMDGALETAFAVRTSGQLMETLRTQTCDVLVTDYSMAQHPHGGDGLAMVERILRQFPACRLVVFTMLHNPAVFGQLLALGVDGIVSKNDDIHEVLLAIRAIEAGIGLPYRSPSVRDALSCQVNLPGAALQALSQRELEVVRLFAQGQTLDDIAANLGRAKTTVATHKKNAMDKLGVISNTELIRYAFEANLV